LQQIPDLRFGRAPLPEPSPGVDPAGDALALVARGVQSPALTPVPGRLAFGSLGPGQRYVVRLPDAWNGKLVAAGTPATRSEFASDLIWCEYALSRGYAFAAGNKGIPFNGILEEGPGDRLTYELPFDLPGVTLRGRRLRFGALEPQPMSLLKWYDDFAATIETARALIGDATGREPERTYAVGLSYGGSQVRKLLETRPDLADGGVEWASVFWSPARHLLKLLPGFLRIMPRYVQSGYRDRNAHAEIVALGFPPDRTQDDPHHPSLWADYYSNSLPFYNDVTTFVFGRLIDPDSPEDFGLEQRAAYVPSAAAQETVESIAHSGALKRPLIGIAGNADVFVTPEDNLKGYAAAVEASGASENYRAYLVDDGTHVDGFTGFGYGLQPQLPFAWAAFEQLERIVERGAKPRGTGTVRRVAKPAEISAAG
jgi:hypothetical protein